MLININGTKPQGEEQEKPNARKQAGTINHGRRVAAGQGSGGGGSKFPLPGRQSLIPWNSANAFPEEKGKIYNWRCVFNGPTSAKEQ